MVPAASGPISVWRDGNLCVGVTVVSFSRIRNVNVSLAVTDTTPQSA